MYYFPYSTSPDPIVYPWLTPIRIPMTYDTSQTNIFYNNALYDKPDNTQKVKPCTC